MNIYYKLALLTDTQAERCLNGVIKAKAVMDPAFERLTASPEEMQKAIQKAAEVQNIADVPGNEMVAPQDTEKTFRSVRLVLVQAAEEPQLRQAIEDYLASQRDVLIEPVTTALVLAGIVFVLSTKFNVHFEDVEGKKQVKVDVNKEPATESLLDKFFDIFRPAKL